MGIVYAKESAAVQHGDGAPIVIPRGTAYDDTHHIVKAHPELFEVEPSRVAGRPAVERATRAPGERRTTRAPRGQSAAAKRKAAAAAKKEAAEKEKAGEAAKVDEAKASESDGAE